MILLLRNELTGLLVLQELVYHFASAKEGGVKKEVNRNLICTRVSHCSTKSKQACSLVFCLFRTHIKSRL